jgi:hypothetical protein
MSSKNILIIAANPSVSTTLGWPVGFWAAEWFCGQSRN